MKITVQLCSVVLMCLLALRYSLNNGWSSCYGRKTRNCRNDSYPLKSGDCECQKKCLLLTVPQVSGDDWRVSTILESTIDQYVKPYTGSLVEKVTSSTLWNVFGKTINGVQGAINLTGGYLQAYYQDHLKAPTENTLQWIENKTKPIVDRVRERFQKDGE